MGTSTQQAVKRVWARMRFRGYSHLRPPRSEPHVPSLLVYFPLARELCKGLFMFLCISREEPRIPRGKGSSSPALGAHCTRAALQSDSQDPCSPAPTCGPSGSCLLCLLPSSSGGSQTPSHLVPSFSDPTCLWGPWAENWELGTPVTSPGEHRPAESWSTCTTVLFQVMRIL